MTLSLHNHKTFLLLTILCSLLWACEPPSSPVAEELPAAPTEQIASPTIEATSPVPASDGAVVEPLAEVLDLTRQQQAMLPDFVGDVEAVAAAGATRYRLAVTLSEFDDPDGVQLAGQAEIGYTNTESVPLNEIIFRLYPNLIGYGGQMTVQAVSVNGQAVTPQLTAQDSALVVPLSHPLAPQESVNLRLDYQAIVPTQVEFGYNIFSYTDETIVLAGFYPAIAVYDERGWHTLVPPYYGDATYLDIALFEVALTAPPSWVVAASGNLVETTTHADDTQTLTFVSGPMRDFYIAMRQDYEVISETVDGVLVNSYYPPDLADGGEAVLRFGVDSLRLFNDRFGPYPYAEFDIVGTPTRAGGIEYPGIVVIANGLYQPENRFLQHVVGHEVAHQWWYAVVGNNQIEHPWLDEALTNYSTLLYWEAVTDERVADQIVQDFFVNPYEAAVSAGRDRPVSGAVAEFDEGDYGAIVYGKGPLFFLALHEEVGDDVFYEILQTYYTDYRYDLADPAEFVAVVEQVYGRSIRPLYETWIVGQ